MSIGRVVLGVATGLAGWFLAKQVKKLQNELEQQAAQDSRQSNRAPSSAKQQPQAMVECAYCGLHFPQTDAVTRGGQRYCSAEHAAQAASM